MKTAYLLWAGIFALGFAGVGCSSSSPGKKLGNDAAGDLGDGSAPSGDVAAVSEGKDGPGAILPVSDAGTAGGEVAALDVAGNDVVAAPDAPVVDAPKTDVLAADTALGDLATDQVPRCNPDAFPPSCNDDLKSEAIMGTCQADGTCLCKSGYVLNPSTGRCRYPLRDASVPTDTGTAGTCSGDYTACGCGCCAGATPNLRCYYPELGESISDISARDQATKSSTDCSQVGCAIGTHYFCCEAAAPEPASSASYTVDWYSGDMDHLSILKSGADCARLYFSRPESTSSSSGLRIETPARWGVDFASFGACSDAGAMPGATDGFGTLVLRASGSTCVADVHVALFVLSAAGEVKSTRLDVDGLVIDGAPADYFCR